MMKFKSLRLAALVWMTVLLALVGIATFVISYRLARDETAEFLDGQLRQVALNAGKGLRAGAVAAVDQDPEDQLAVTIWDADRRIVHASLPDVKIALPDRPGFSEAMAAGERWRVFVASDDGRTVQVAQRATVRDEIASSAALGAAAPLLIVIPLSWLVVGWALSRTLGRLDLLARDIATRGASAAAPIPLAGIPSEVMPMVQSINGLIGRLGAALAAQKRFVADAAHELRTPLAAMQIQVDGLSQSGAENFAARKEALTRGVRRASALIDQLLRLARLDEPALPAVEEIDIAQLVLDCASDYVVVANQKGVDLGVEAAAEARISGNAEELRVLFSNLIENAVRYTPSGGTVDVFVRLRNSHAVVEVIDTGCGLPPGAEARIFDRFYRGAPPETEGSGLGLAIAWRIAERNGLLLTVENRPDGRQGVLARVELPVDDRNPFTDSSFSPHSAGA
jgi:two-component system OmpR family sensor kinase